MADVELTQREKDISQTLNYFSSLQILYSLDPAEKARNRASLVSLLSNVEAYVTPDNNDIDLIIQIYHILQETDKRLRFSQLFEDASVNVLLAYNLAYCFQQKRDYKNTLTFITIAIIELEAILRNGRGPTRSAASWLRLNKFLANVYLQTTALYSQLKENDKALRIAEQSFDQICVTVGLLKDMGRDAPGSGENARSLHRFAAELQASVRGGDDYALRVKNSQLSSLHWLHNEENIRKFLQTQGLPDVRQKYDAEWLKSYSISDIMFLELLNLRFFAADEPAVDIRFPLDCVNLLAAACYSIATEKRIIGSRETKTQITDSLTTPPSKSAKIVDFKTQNLLRKNKSFLQSEFFYTKAIEVLNGFLAESLILSTLVANFRANYNLSFNHITEEEEMSYTASHVMLSEKKAYPGEPKLSNESLMEKDTGTTAPSSETVDHPTASVPSTEGPAEEGKLFSGRSVSPLRMFKKKRNPSDLAGLETFDRGADNSLEQDTLLKRQLYKHSRQGKSTGQSRLRWLSGQLASMPEVDRVHIKSELAAFFKKRKAEQSSDKISQTFDSNRLFQKEDQLNSERALTGRMHKAAFLLHPSSLHKTVVKKSASQSKLNPETRSREPRHPANIVSRDSKRPSNALESMLGRPAHARAASTAGVFKAERCFCCQKVIVGPKCENLLSKAGPLPKHKCHVFADNSIHHKKANIQAAQLSGCKALNASSGLALGPRYQNTVEDPEYSSARRDKRHPEPFSGVAKSAKQTVAKSFLGAGNLAFIR